MARIEDHNKPNTEEQAALEQVARERRSSTLLKDERTAQYLQRERIKEHGETRVTDRDVQSETQREEKYGRADWTPPDLTKVLPKPPSDALWEALERFVQLSDSGLKDFQSRYPSFMPAWFYSLACGNNTEPKAKTGLLAWQAWRNLLRETWHTSFNLEYVAQLVNLPTTPPGNVQFEIQPACDGQRAVLAMMLESWRARFCPRCGRPFVARKAADKYWPKACFEQQRRENQRASKRKRARKRAKSLRRKQR